MFFFLFHLHKQIDVRKPFQRHGGKNGVVTFLYLVKILRIYPQSSNLNQYSSDPWD